RPVRGGALPPPPRRAPPGRAAVRAVLRRAGHQLRDRAGASPRPAPAPRRPPGLAARFRRAWPVAVGRGQVRLPPGGQPAHPDPALGPVGLARVVLAPVVLGL